MTHLSRKMKICYILSYRDPNYIRTRTLVKALRKLETIELFEAGNVSKGFLRYFETLFRLFVIRNRHHPDVYVLGFRGHDIFPVVRWITRKRRLVFDAMVSPFESLYQDRKFGWKGQMISPVVYLFEKMMLKNADVVLADTDLHRQYYLDTFSLPPEKVKTVYVGTDEDMFRPNGLSENQEKEIFEVFHYSTFLPLHGIDYILEAAETLRDYPIRFTIIGGRGKRLNDLEERIKHSRPKNIVHLEWVEFEKLKEYASNADLCLGGPFGNTSQGQKVITGKTYQFLALGKPTVIGKIGEDVGLVDKFNCLLVEQGNSKAITDAILWAFNNKDRLPVLGRSGQSLYMEKFSTHRIMKSLQEIVFRSDRKSLKNLRYNAMSIPK